MATRYAKMTREQKDAANARNKRWKEKNYDKVIKYKRKHYQDNREKFLRIERERAWTKIYGITAEDYERMLLEQDGRCRICKTNSPGKRTVYFAVDHDHGTGEVRGLLCVKCNWRLGWFEQHQAAVTAYLSRKKSLAA